MSLATSPAQSTTPYTVVFASGNRLASELTRGELQEYNRLPRDNAGRRRDWLAGRWAAKRAVAVRSGVPVERLQLASRAGAGPQCMKFDGERWTHLRISISIAHCDGIAIAAAADNSTRIGVDIERVDEIAPEHRRYFLAPAEECVDASLAWVLKEAAWKALGLGHDVPFTSVQLSFDRDGGILERVRLRSEWMSARADVIRFSYRRPMLAVVLEIGEIGESGASEEELQ